MSEQQRAIKDVADERRRQQASEGYEPEHDDEYVRGELAYAAACYALSGARHPEKVPGIWPWQQSAFKPKSRREDLVRAGALVLAEIERLDRAAFADQPADAGEASGLDAAERCEHGYPLGACIVCDAPAEAGEADDRLPQWVCDHPGFKRAIRAACQSAEERTRANERERCARIAENCQRPSSDRDRDGIIADGACRFVARAIRRTEDTP